MAHDEHFIDVKRGLVFHDEVDPRLPGEAAASQTPATPRRFKRFMVFGWYDDDAGGGLNDCLDSFDSIEEARTAVSQSTREDHQILDRETGEDIE